MDKKYKKERFESLSIKRSVAKKFRGYSRSISRFQSMTLLAMLEFFEANGISPGESIEPQVRTLESLVKKRINSVIAILKDIERTQTRPTAAMMQSLFEAAEPKKKSLMVEKKPEDIQESLKSTENNQNS
ncbi:MAG TPA: hypothetical protein ENH91_06200 [Leeuwenhoekiella sp.]|nr:hypothetical protein [Leeuwenhoekiella sp.]